MKLKSSHTGTGTKSRDNFCFVSQMFFVYPLWCVPPCYARHTTSSFSNTTAASSNGAEDAVNSVRKDFLVSVEFLSWPIIRYKKEVLFGWVDLLVSFGGIAGLFLGFSLLSGIEIIYFYTMRTCCMFVKNRVSSEAWKSFNSQSSRMMKFSLFSLLLFNSIFSDIHNTTRSNFINYRMKRIHDLPSSMTWASNPHSWGRKNLRLSIHSMFEW